MDNKKCLMINGAIERKDGKEIDINNFVDKFVNFIEQEGYFYGGGIKYDKELKEKKLSEYTKSEMLDLENRVESLIEECNKENQIIVGYKLDKEYDDLIILRGIKKGKTYSIFSILEKQLNKYPYLNDNEVCKIKVINLNTYFGGNYIEII